MRRVQVDSLDILRKMVMIHPPALHNFLMKTPNSLNLLGKTTWKLCVQVHSVVITTQNTSK